MKKMRKLFIVCIAILFSAGTMFSQDMATAVEIYNAGGKALGENNYPAAIESFEKALAMLEGMSAEEIGDDGKDMIDQAKGIIPQIHLRYAKELINAKEFDKALAEIDKTVASGEKYGATDIATDAKDLIPQVLLANGMALFGEKKNAEAVTAFKKVIEMDPDNVNAYYGMGAAEAGLSNIDGAIAAFEKALELGDSRTVKQLATMYVMKASEANKAKNMQEAFNNAIKADGYEESANSKLLAGQAAYQLKKYDDAIKYLEAYIAIAPNAQNKPDMIYIIALCYEGKNDGGKACGYFKQLMNNAKYKEVATHKVNVQYKC